MIAQPFKVYNNKLIISARACFGASNIWQFFPDLFVDRIRQSSCDELDVYAIDCEDVIISGFLAVLQVAVKECRLAADKVRIIAFNDPKVEWATFVQWNPFPLNGWVRQQINREEFIIDNTKFTKPFLALFNRFTIHRFRMAKYLYQNLFDKTMLSCRMGKDEIQRQLKNVDAEFYKDEIEWAYTLPLILDYNAPVYKFDYHDMVKSIQKHKSDYLIEIVFESNIYDSMVFTEKTVRSFYTGKPFILFAGPGAIANLQNWGFKTFSPFINESYDQIENTEDRFRAICAEVNRIGNLPRSELVKMAKHLHSNLEHNQRVFFNESHLWSKWKPTEYSYQYFN